jgi:hypothetical protein
MTNFCTCHKQYSLLCQSRDSNHHLSDANCHTYRCYKRYSTQHRSSSNPGVIRRHSTRILAVGVSVSTSPIAGNTLTYVHTTSLTLPSSDMSLDSLTLAMPDVEDYIITRTRSLQEFSTYLKHTTAPKRNCISLHF